MVNIEKKLQTVDTPRLFLYFNIFISLLCQALVIIILLFFQFIYSFPSVWICVLTLWAYLVIYAPVIFDPEDQGILPVSAPLDVGGTTPKPDDSIRKM